MKVLNLLCSLCLVSSSVIASGLKRLEVDGAATVRLIAPTVSSKALSDITNTDPVPAEAIETIEPIPEITGTRGEKRPREELSEEENPRPAKKQKSEPLTIKLANYIAEIYEILKKRSKTYGAIYEPATKELLAYGIECDATSLARFVHLVRNNKISYIDGGWDEKFKALHLHMDHSKKRRERINWQDGGKNYQALMSAIEAAKNMTGRLTINVSSILEDQGYDCTYANIRKLIYRYTH